MFRGLVSWRLVLFQAAGCSNTWIWFLIRRDGILRMAAFFEDTTVSEVSAQLAKSLSMDTDQSMETYHRIIRDGKATARRGDLPKALEFFKLAYNIHQSEKLKSRIQTIEAYIAEDDSQDEDDKFVHVNDSGLLLFKDLHDKLYDYQRNGVAFLYSLYRDDLKGGILADDMGLGKTIQVISFLSGMYDNELIKHTLLVMPTSLITNWTKEFANWTPGMRVKNFHGENKERTRNLEKIQRAGGVIITTYNMIVNNWQQLSSYHGREFTWDYMILDEAHKIKSTTTKRAKSAYAVPSKNRVLLTGTPVQNNLKEMWALFDFACQGTLLGTAKTFKTEYENPITRAREKDATPGEKALGSRMSENLMTIIKPYFLRRTKSEVQKTKKNGTHPSKEDDSQVQDDPKGSGVVMPKLSRKNDLIVWTYLSAVQEDIYRQFISLDHIKELLLTTKSPLAELGILKKLCDHPRLLSAKAIAKLGLEEGVGEDQQNDDMNTETHSIASVPDDTLISESGKLVFLSTLLERLTQEGHRTLVFAHYRKVLDIIERILVNRGFKVLRLDGAITQIAERERLISLFQKDERYSVFLLTTEVGGVGITLTAADRVVIYDPSWNPATDAQAVDRAYRIGQAKNVVVYRLVTCGTVEEKIYRRQVFKDSLIRQNTGDKKNPFRYFSKQELKELFTLEDTRCSSTQLQLQALHSRHRRTDPELDEHISHLHTMEMFGISDHDLMFSLDVHNDEALDDQQEHQYIEGRVHKAQELMKAESELQMQLAESLAFSTEPAWLRQPMDNRESPQEKKQTSPRPSPSYPQHDHKLKGSPVVLELDHSGSDGDTQQNLSKEVIDLIADESLREEEPDVDLLEQQNLDSPQPQLTNQGRSYVETAEDFPQQVVEESLVMVEAADAATGDASVQELMCQSTMSEAADAATGDASVQELMCQSTMSEAAGASPREDRAECVTASDDYDQQLNGTSHSKYHNSMTNLSQSHITTPQNKRLSLLQASDLSFKADTSSRVSAGFESLGGIFNLQLEDSEMFSDHDAQDQPETEAEERKLLLQLQVEGSFDVDESLSEPQHGGAAGLSSDHASEMDKSTDDSIVVARKKKAAVIYDSDDDDERQQFMHGQLYNSFELLGVSTPKSVPSTPLRSRGSIGGNTSVASRQSHLLSIIQNMEDCNKDMEQEEEGDEADLDLEEKVGETLNTEEEEEEEEEEGEEEVEEQHLKSGEEMSFNLEESTSEPELLSSERMDQCTVDAGIAVSTVDESESYDSLVSRGRKCYSKGKLVDALSFFLRAIDIKPGDPEIQLMTIQLYRQLSQRR